MTEADPPQIDQVGEECMTSTPMRRTQPISQPSSYPINQALFSEAPPDTTKIEDRLKELQMFSDKVSENYVESLVHSLHKDHKDEFLHTLPNWRPGPMLRRRMWTLAICLP